ncbi:uncharacterized protein BHQ10_010141 [Talaromyces amestolkiae]|uniref:DUF1214 domain-containing protein n=1 Tax=Talaromyces amestolkiae TaxID=1196081 RepID=A0A364LED2_TALAM|nr:uncharacterized protein BHQ10_010141 [Talaromyces amestolkiae]RAO74129.1 hypothetical protein BHQ10_010141 [Talaromyces amestolkiae]
MKALLGLRRLEVVVAIATIIGSVRASSENYGNPLATSDQKALDALAIELFETWSFPVLQAEAKAAYQTAHGLPISDEASSSLDAAIEELAFSALQKAINNDPYYPKVYWVDSAPRNWFGLDVPGGRYSYDNPDCIYRTIPIDSSADYVLKGYRYTPGPSDVTFSLISDPNSQNTVAFLAGSGLVVDDDGSYTITINSSSTDSQTNHIQSNSSAVQLLIRENLGDWQTEKPDNITVEVTSNITGHDPISTAQIIVDAQWNLQESIVDYGVGALGLKTSINAVNTLSTPSQSSSLGTLTSQASSFGHFKITNDEALVATLTPGAADYFVFPVTNPWLVTTSPGTSQDSLNSKQAIANDNGTYTFVVSIGDPGVYNWVNTTGLHEGTIMARWQGLSTSSSADDTLGIHVQLVSLSDLATVLPKETVYVTAEERAAQLADRVAGYAQRLDS